jgi:iron complex transport system permease protein
MIAGVSYSFLPVLAFAGGLVTSLIVAMLSKSSNGLSISRLLLAGIGLSAICGAVITMILVHTSLSAQGQGLFFWLYGGIAGRTWTEFGPAAVCTAIGAITAFAMTKQIRLLSLGADAAQSLGLDVSRTQWMLLSAAVLMCGAAVSVSGLVGFVGLIAPHLARSLFGRDERWHLVSAGMLGMVLVLLSDLAARTLGQGQELPLGTLLSLVGGPFFLILISRRSAGRQ